MADIMAPGIYLAGPWCPRVPSKNVVFPMMRHDPSSNLECYCLLLLFFVLMFALCLYNAIYVQSYRLHLGRVSSIFEPVTKSPSIPSFRRLWVSRTAGRVAERAGTRKCQVGQQSPVRSIMWKATVNRESCYFRQRTLDACGNRGRSSSIQPNCHVGLVNRLHRRYPILDEPLS